MMLEGAVFGKVEGGRCLTVVNTYERNRTWLGGDSLTKPPRRGSCTPAAKQAVLVAGGRRCSRD